MQDRSFMYDCETDWSCCDICGNDGTSVSPPELEQRKPLSRKGGDVDVELGRNISCDCADRRPVGAERCCRSGNSDRLDIVCRVLDPLPRGLGHGSKTACLASRRNRSSIDRCLSRPFTFCVRHVLVPACTRVPISGSLTTSTRDRDLPPPAFDDMGGGAMMSHIGYRVSCSPTAWSVDHK